MYITYGPMVGVDKGKKSSFRPHPQPFSPPFCISPAGEGAGISSPKNQCSVPGELEAKSWIQAELERSLFSVGREKEDMYNIKKRRSPRSSIHSYM